MPAAGAPTFSTATLKELCGWRRAAGHTDTNTQQRERNLAPDYGTAICFYTLTLCRIVSSHIQRESYIQCTVTARTMRIQKMVFQQLWGAVKTNSFCSRCTNWIKLFADDSLLFAFTAKLNIKGLSLSLLPDNTIQVSLTAEDPVGIFTQSRAAAQAKITQHARSHMLPDEAAKQQLLSKDENRILADEQKQPLL